MKSALCTWAQPTARLGLLGQAAQLPWAIRPMTEETGEGESPSTPTAYRPNPADRQPLVSGKAAWE
jgi:hypothetical protein